MFSGNSAVLEKELNRFIKKCMGKLRVRNSSAVVFLLKNEELRRLKSLYYRRRGKNAVSLPKNKTRTIVDVLAFPEPKSFPHPDTKKRQLGQIYVNHDIALGNRWRGEALAAHGFLHLLGYTHDGKRDTMEMQKKEAKLLYKKSAGNRAK